MFDLEAQRIEASGHPVIVRAPSQELEGRGERLLYDLLNATVVMDAAGEAFLRRGPAPAADEIHGPHLEYQVAQQGRLGRALVDGPGWLRMAMKTQAGGNGLLVARWDKQFRLQPDEDQHVISLKGNAHDRPCGDGESRRRPDRLLGPRGPTPARPPQAAATQAAATQAAAPQTEIIPKRMRAQGQVRLESAKVSAAVQEMQVWFRQAAADWEPVPAGGAGAGPPPPKPAIGAAASPAPPGGAPPGNRCRSSTSWSRERC